MPNHKCKSYRILSIEQEVGRRTKKIVGQCIDCEKGVVFKGCYPKALEFAESSLLGDPILVQRLEVSYTPSEPSLLPSAITPVQEFAEFKNFGVGDDCSKVLLEWWKLMHRHADPSIQMCDSIVDRLRTETERLELSFEYIHGIGIAIEIIEKEFINA